MQSGKSKKLPILYMILTKAGVYPSWLFLRLGLSANQVTVLSFLIGLGGCVMIALGDFFTTLLGIILLQIWILLDYADGNVARYNGKCTPLGAFIDRWNINFIYLLSMISIGAGLSRKPDPYFLILVKNLFRYHTRQGVYLVIGLYTSFIYSLCRWLRAAVYSETPLVNRRIKVASHSPKVLRSMFERFYGLTYSPPFYILMFLAATILGITGMFLLFLASIHTVYFIRYAMYTLRRLKKLETY